MYCNTNELKDTYHYNNAEELIVISLNTSLLLNTSRTSILSTLIVFLCNASVNCTTLLSILVMLLHNGNTDYS
jgi:hypothetical protein